MQASSTDTSIKSLIDKRPIVRYNALSDSIIEKMHYTLLFSLLIPSMHHFVQAR